MTEIADRLLSTVKGVVGPKVLVELDSTISELDLDSLGFFELRLAIEEEFDIEMEAESFLHSKKVSDLVELLRG